MCLVSPRRRVMVGSSSRSLWSFLRGNCFNCHCWATLFQICHALLTIRILRTTQNCNKIPTSPFRPRKTWLSMVLLYEQLQYFMRSLTCIGNRWVRNEEKKLHARHATDPTSGATHPTGAERWTRWTEKVLPCERFRCQVSSWEEHRPLLKGSHPQGAHPLELDEKCMLKNFQACWV